MCIVSIAECPTGIDLGCRTRLCPSRISYPPSLGEVTTCRRGIPLVRDVQTGLPSSFFLPVVRDAVRLSAYDPLHEGGGGIAGDLSYTLHLGARIFRMLYSIAPQTAMSPLGEWRLAGLNEP